MGTLVYFFKEAIRGFYQAKLMTFVSILSITASLVFLGSVVIAFINVSQVVRKSTDQADIAAYLKEDAGEDSTTITDLVEQIASLMSVKNVKVISKDSAWERFSELYGEEMLEAVDDNPLPVSLEIFLKDEARSQDAVQRVTDVISAYEEIESVRYSREWIDLIEQFQIIFAIAAALVGCVMVFILYLMISNTIRLTIYARRDLVAHMQVVGATDFFIKMPFILEGILQAIIGGVLYIMVMGVLRLLLFRFPIYWGPHSLPLFIIFIGVVFGWLGSARAVRKFLV